MPADRRLDSVAGCATFPTARQPPRSGDRQNHLASEAAGYTPGTPSRRRTTPRTPETSEGNQPQRQDASSLPSPDTISCGNVCEGDTHYAPNRRSSIVGSAPGGRGPQIYPSSAL